MGELRLVLEVGAVGPCLHRLGTTAGMTGSVPKSWRHFAPSLQEEPAVQQGAIRRYSWRDVRWQIAGPTELCCGHAPPTSCNPGEYARRLDRPLRSGDVA